MVVDNTSNCDPFEILYGLNPLTPIYLLTMSNIYVLKHKDTQGMMRTSSKVFLKREGMMRTSKPKGHAQQDWNLKIK